MTGKREIMQLMAHRGDPAWDRSERVAPQGTFNANPLSAVAGIATLEVIADGSLQARANKLGEELRSALSDVMKRAGAPGAVLGESSIYHLSFEGRSGLAGFDRPRQTDLYHVLRCALLNNGADCSLYHGWVSAVHTEEDLALSVRGYEQALAAMAAEGWFGVS